MDDSDGRLGDHGAAIDSTPGLQGGFIRGSRDHGSLRRVNDGGPAGTAPRRRAGGSTPPTPASALPPAGLTPRPAGSS
ncbi:hypothetical protein, partial [Streptomyces kaempferi]